MSVPSDELTRRVLCNSVEYMQLFKTEEKRKENHRWQPPTDGMLKANLDGAYRPGESFVTWGIVIRDEMGDVVTVRAGRTEHVADSFGAEATAMTEAINTVADLGALQVVFETDSKLLQEALDLTKVDSSPYAALIEDSKFQLKMWFSKQQVVLCRRNANSVAHELAQVGRVCLPNECVVWNSDVPPHVAICVSGDLPEHR